MSEAPYRGGVPEARLPLARHHLSGWCAALVALAALAALALPLASIDAAGGVVAVLHTGGASNLAVVGMLDVMIIPILTMFGILAARGRERNTAPLLALALAPLLVSITFAVQNTRSNVAALAALPPEYQEGLAPRTFAETECLMLLGSTVSAAGCAVVAMSCAAAVATLDRRRAGVPPGRRWIPLAVGAAWFVVGFAVRIAWPPGGVGAALLATSMAMPLAFGVLASLAASALPALCESADSEERTASVAALVTGGVAATFAAVLVDRAAFAVVEIRALTAVVDVSVSDRLPLLAGLAGARRAHAAATLVDGIGCAACFLAPLASALRTLRGRAMTFPASLALALGLAALAAGALYGSAAASAAARREIGRAQAASHVREPGVALPVVSAGQGRPLRRGSRVVYDEDGAAPDRPSRIWERTGETTEIVVDRHVAFEAIAPLRPHGDGYRFVAETSTCVDPRVLGDLSVFAPTPDVGVDVIFVPRVASPVGALIATLEDAAVVRLVFAGRERAVFMGATEDAADRARAVADIVGRARIAHVRLDPRPDDPVGRVVAVAAALEAAVASNGNEALVVELGVPVESQRGRAEPDGSGQRALTAGPRPSHRGSPSTAHTSAGPSAP